MSTPEFPGAKPPAIPDYHLLRKIGRGAFGDVWIGQNITGAWRAIKVVTKDRFTSLEPYEREFRGLKRFADISLKCPRQLALLHVGSNEAEGFFYSVMELADDVDTGRDIHPASYVPLTLRELRSRKGRLPARDVVRIAVDLADALRELHDQKLIHRDIKPSNVILVGGVPKLADIGLVAHEEDAPTMAIGTEGYLPPEGPGKAQADIYATGKVLYELATGMDRKEYPRLPQSLSGWTDQEEFFELITVIRKACDPSLEKRHATAFELLQELRLLQGGKSVIRLRFAELWIGRAWKALLAMAAVAFGVFWLYLREKSNERAQRERLADNLRQAAFRLANEGNVLGSLPWTVQASRLRPDNSPNRQDDMHQLALALQNAQHLVVLHRYSNNLSDVRFTPDNKWLAVAVDGGSVDFWDPKTRKIEFSLYSGTGTDGRPPSHRVDIQQLVFSKDGKLLIGSGQSNGVFVWNMEQPQAPPRILPHPKGAKNSSITDDGRYVATNGRDNVLRLWDLQTQRLLNASPQENLSMTGFSPDGKRLAASYLGKASILFDVENKSNEPVPVLSYPHYLWQYSVSFAPDGQTFATACADQNVYVWSCSHTNLLMQLSHSALVFDARFSANGKQILSRAREGYVRLWNVQNVRGLPLSLPDPENSNAADLSPDGHWVATGAGNGLLRIWAMRNPAAEPFTPTWTPVFSMDRWIATTNRDGLMPVQVLKDNAVQTEWHPITNVFASLQGPDHSLQFTALRTKQYATLFWRSPDKGSSPEVKAVITPTPCLQIFHASPALGRVLYRSRSNEIVLLDLPTQTIITQHRLPKSNYGRSRQHPGGKWCALETQHDIDVIHLETGAYRDCIVSNDSTDPFFKSHSEFSPDGKFLAASGASGSVESTDVWIFDVSTENPTFKPVQRLQAHTDGVVGLAFSPDSSMLVSVGEDRKAYVWNTRDWKRRLDPLRHSGEVWGAAISSDNRVLLTSSESRPGITDALQLWDLKSGEPLSSRIIVQADITKLGYLPEQATWVWTTRGDGYTFDPGRVFLRQISSKTTGDLLQKATSQMGYTVDAVGNLRSIPLDEQMNAHLQRPISVTVSP